METRQAIRIGPRQESVHARPVPEVKSVGQRPVKVFRNGSCCACVFYNRVNVGNDEIEKPSVSFAKLYLKHGLMKKTTSLRQEDLPAAILVLGQAHEWLGQMDKDMYGVVDDD